MDDGCSPLISASSVHADMRFISNTNRHLASGTAGAACSYEQVPYVL